MEKQTLLLSLNAMLYSHDLILNTGTMLSIYVEGWNYDLTSRINEKQRS